MPAPTTGKQGIMSGPPPPNGAYHQPPQYGNQPHFQQPPYGGPPPPNGQFPPNGGYMWQGQQQQQQQSPAYGAPGWQGQAPPMGMYRQGGPSGPPGPPPNGMDRGNWNGGYRGGPPPPQQQGRRPPPPATDQHSSPPRQAAGGKQEGGNYWGQQQWPQHQQWQGGPPPPPPHGWQGGPPPIQQQPGPSPPPNMPQHMQGPPKIWGRNGMTSPVRGGGPRRSPETMPGMMNGYPARMNGMDPMCKTIDGDQDMYMSRDDQKGGKGMSQHDKDKGRGSYRCGRCGAPKKGHVCPYQPKLKRRPDEPPPEMRNAAIQVEMDEFMTVRRLNIEIQGFPESYATAPLMSDNMVVGEPHPLAVNASVGTNLEMPQVPMSSPLPETPDTMRSSPGPSPVVETGV